MNKIPKKFKMRFLNEKHVLIVLIILFKDKCRFVNQQKIEPHWRFGIPKIGLIKDNQTLYQSFGFTTLSSFNLNDSIQLDSSDFIKDFGPDLLDLSILQLIEKIEAINSKL